MPTGFGINDFMSSIEGMGGLARRWKYSIQITPPQSLRTSVPTGKIDFLALTVLLPSKQFSTTEHRIYGINKTVPYETTYDPVLITMLNPNDWSTRKFWNDWLNHMQVPNTKNMRYYKDMIGQIKISHYDEEANILDPASARYTVILREAYPERISAYAMGYENADFGNFEISLRYKEWEEDRRGARAGS